MLLLTAILRLWVPQEAQPNDLLARTRVVIGHVALAIISLVYILITYWQH